MRINLDIDRTNLRNQFKIARANFAAIKNGDAIPFDVIRPLIKKDLFPTYPKRILLGLGNPDVRIYKCPGMKAGWLPVIIDTFEKISQNAYTYYKEKTHTADELTKPMTMGKKLGKDHVLLAQVWRSRDGKEILFTMAIFPPEVVKKERNREISRFIGMTAEDLRNNGAFVILQA